MTKEEQCEVVREWCKANGVCPPTEGWEWIWYDRLFGLAEAVRSLPAFKVAR